MRPIARGIAGPGLIAQIIVGKFGDHLPLYRQEDFFTRHGLHIPRSTLCDWVQAAAELLRPLYERQKELVLQVARAVDRRHARDRADGRQRRQSPGTLLDLHRRSSIPTRCTTSPRVVPAMDRPSSWQDSKVTSMPMPTAATTTSIWGRTTRSAKLPAGRMRGASSSTRGHSSPRDAHQILEWIRQLYDIEDRARELSADARRELRVAEAEPVLDRIEARLAELEKRALPKSALGEGGLVRPQPVAGTLSLHRGWSAVDRQQRQRTNAASPGDREKELVVPGQPASRAAGGRLVHDPRRRQASSHRTVDLPA